MWGEALGKTIIYLIAHKHVGKPTLWKVLDVITFTRSKLQTFWENDIGKCKLTFVGNLYVVNVWERVLSNPFGTDVLQIEIVNMLSPMFGRYLENLLARRVSDTESKSFNLSLSLWVWVWVQIFDFELWVIQNKHQENK